MEFIIKHFRELSVDEFYEIAKARFEVFVMDQKIICEQDYDDKDKDCYHVYLEDNKKVIAYSRIVPKGLSYEDVSIGRVLVLNEYRRRGIANKMMEECIKFINNTLNEEQITLSAQEYVKDLYLSVGFKPIGEVYEEAEIPHIKMKYKK